MCPATWDVLRRLLHDPAARSGIEALRPPAATAVSLLRILDVALWVSTTSTARHPDNLAEYI